MLLSNKEKQVLGSQREIEWLNRKILQLNDENNAEDINIPDSATTEHVKASLNIYKEHVNKMKEELVTYVEYNKSKEEALKAVNEQHFTIEALYPQPSTSREMHKMHKIEQSINKRDALVKELLTLLQEYNKHKIKLTQLQKDIIIQHLNNRNALTRIKSFSPEISPEIVQPLEETKSSIREQRDHVSSIRSVLNGLILESGVDWVNDEALFSIITRIGEPI